MGVAGVDPAFWRGRRVLVTGHTGFKGAWLSLWLQALGARVSGFSGGSPTQPSLHQLARVGEGIAETDGDVRDQAAVATALSRERPEVVIHMAAQALVRRSLAAPRETYEVNVMGTVNLLEAVRSASEVRAVIVVTSDKCYANARGQRVGAQPQAFANGSPAGFREGDPLGGDDPYSSSKAAVELVVAGYRSALLADGSGARTATARAGNVIGGGDWGGDRLVPDLMRAAIAGQTARLRNPDAVRPWQHVLAPLSGYLVLAQALWDSSAAAGAWNFGPPQHELRPVGWVADRLAELWPGGLRWEHDERAHPHERAWLGIDSAKAREQLGWREPMTLEAALAATAEWYARFRDGADMREVTLEQIATLCGSPRRAAQEAAAGHSPQGGR